MHRERTGTHMNAWKRRVAHRSARERHIMTDKGHFERPVNSRMSKQLTYAIVAADVLNFVLLMRILFALYKYMNLNHIFKSNFP